MPNEILKTLKDIKLLILADKRILNVNELSMYTGWSTSYIYKLTSSRRLPHYKTQADAKVIYFKRKEIDNWMTAHKVLTSEEIATSIKTRK